jgi:hypothetical protein
MSPMTEAGFSLAGALASSVDSAEVITSRDDERRRRLVKCCEGSGAAGRHGGSTVRVPASERLEEHDMVDIAAAELIPDWSIDGCTLV